MEIWMPSVHSLLMLWRPNLVRNWSIVYCIKWYLHDVDTVIIWVAMSRWTIRSYPYPKNNGIPKVVTIFWYNKKQTTILLLPMELTLAQSLYILKVIFSMIYLSFLIYPYAVHSPVPHLLIRSLYWWAYTGGSHDDKLFFNHSAQCLSLFKLFTTMHIQCLPIPPCLPMCFSCQLDESYGFSGDHLQNAEMLQCASRYLQSISVTVSLLHSVGNKT